MSIDTVAPNPKQSPAVKGGVSTAAMALLVAVAAAMAALAYPVMWKSDNRGNGGLEHELGPLLSPGASIYLPGTPEFSDKTTRWIDSLSPDIGAVVVVATEEDVQQTVRGVS